jgi:hypothetical protein
MTPDRRGFRSVSFVMAGDIVPTHTNGGAPDPKAEGPVFLASLPVAFDREGRSALASIVLISQLPSAP